MQRYFFHTDDGQSFHDEEGTLLSGPEAARIEAARVLGQLMNEHPANVWHDDQLRITVTDSTGLILFILDVAALTSPSGGSQWRKTS